MLRIKGIYVVLLLTVLMAVGCYLKGWTAGIALWGFLALVCVGRILRVNRKKDDGEGKE